MMDSGQGKINNEQKAERNCDKIITIRNILEVESFFILLIFIAHAYCCTKLPLLKSVTNDEYNMYVHISVSSLEKILCKRKPTLYII